MAGTEFLSNEQPEKAKLNQKTTYVGTTAGIAALATTYPGQLAYDTDLNTLYVRNAANSAWVTVTTATAGVTAGTETYFTGVADTSDKTVIAGTRYYGVYTLPSTEPFYIITNIRWKIGASASGTVQCGVDLLDTTDPTLYKASTPLVALGAELAASGAAGATQTNPTITSSIIKAGSIIGVWFQCTTTGSFRNLVSSSARHKKATAYPTTGIIYATDNTAWVAADTDRLYITCSYIGYS